MVAAELGLDVGQVGVGGGGELLLPDVTRQLRVDVTSLTKLTIVAQRMQKSGQTFNFDKQCA